MFFIQCLSQPKRCLGGETKASVGVALQAGKIVQQRADFRGGLAFFTDDTVFTLAFDLNSLGAGLIPYPLGFLFNILFVLGKLLVEPAAVVFSSTGRKRAMHLPVIARNEFLDDIFPLDQDRQCGCLYPAHGRLMETAFL